MHQLVSSNNRLITLARRGDRLPHIVLLLVVSIVVTIALAILGTAVALVVLELLGDLGNSALAASTRMMILLICSTSLIFVFLWGWVRWFDRRPYWTLGLETTNACRNYVRGLAVGLALFVAAVGVIALLGYVAPEAGAPQQRGLLTLGGVGLLALGWMVQGASEEVVFRGWLLQSIGARYRPWLGVLVSSLMFALFHALNPGLSLVALANLYLFGLFAALYALYEGSLWGVFALHGVWNWVQGNVFGFEVSGTPPQGATLLNLEETGPDLITGGAFGPEGGLAVTASLLLGIAVVVMIARRRPPPVERAAARHPAPTTRGTRPDSDRA